MRKFISTLLLCSIFPQVVYAQQSEGNVPVISPMSKGKSAPFEGLLLSPAAVAEIIADKSTAEERCKIEIDKGVKECESKSRFELEESKTKLETDVKVLKVDVSSKKEEIQLLQKNLQQEIESRPNTTLWAGGGFFAGITITLLGVFGISQLTK